MGSLGKLCMIPYSRIFSQGIKFRLISVIAKIKTREFIYHVTEFIYLY